MESRKSATRNNRLAAVQFIKAVSFVAVLVSVMTTGSDHKPNPGTRTAFRLLASESKLSPMHSQRTLRFSLAIILGPENADA